MEKLMDKTKARPRTHSYRLGPVAEAHISQVAEEKGWTETQVLKVALEEYHRRVFGRRAADMVPVRQRGSQNNPENV
jgi:hypothetical protein